MSNPEHLFAAADQQLDTLGLRCPEPVMMLHQAIPVVQLQMMLRCRELEVQYKFFRTLYQGLKVLQADLKSERGQAALHKQLVQTDVLITCHGKPLLI